MAPNRTLMVSLVPLIILMGATTAYSQMQAPVAPPAAQAPQDAGAAMINPPIQRPRMMVLGVFDAGQPGVGIFKMFDPSDHVLCYALMPEVAGRKVVGKSIVYDGNSIGSISCVVIDDKSKPAENATANAENKNQKSKK